MDENNNIPQQPEQQPVVPQPPVAPEQPVAPQQPYAAPQPPVAPQQPYMAAPQPGVLLTPPPSAKNKSIAALVLGIVAAVFCWFGWFSIVALALGIVAIVLGVKGRNECPVGYQGRGLATAGLILGIIGTVLSGISVACWICVVVTAGSVAGELSALGDLSSYYY